MTYLDIIEKFKTYNYVWCVESKYYFFNSATYDKDYKHITCHVLFHKFDDTVIIIYRIYENKLFKCIANLKFIDQNTNSTIVKRDEYISIDTVVINDIRAFIKRNETIKQILDV